MESSQSQLFQDLDLPQLSQTDDLFTLPQLTDDLNNPENLHLTNEQESFQSPPYQPLHISPFSQQVDTCTQTPPSGLQNNPEDREIPPDSDLQLLNGTSQAELNPTPTDIDSGILENLVEAGNCVVNDNIDDFIAFPHMANDLITPAEDMSQDHLAINEPCNEVLVPPLLDFFDYMNDDHTNTVNAANEETKQNSDPSFDSVTPLATVAKRMHAGKLNEENEKKFKPKKRGRKRGRKPGTHLSSTSRKVQCDNCGIICRNNTNLRRHMNVAHNGIMDQHCTLCSATFSTTYSRSLHLKRAHKDIPEEEGGPKIYKRRR